MVYLHQIPISNSCSSKIVISINSCLSVKQPPQSQYLLFLHLSVSHLPLFQSAGHFLLCHLLQLMIFFQVRPIFASFATSQESAGLSGLLIIACLNSSYNLVPSCWYVSRLGFSGNLARDGRFIYYLCFVAFIVRTHV